MIRESSKKSDSGVSLTGRQQQILALLAEGKSNKELADELHIQQGTVKQHLFVLFRKLGVSNRAKALLAANHFLKETRVQASSEAKRWADSTTKKQGVKQEYVWRMVSVVSVYVPDTLLSSTENIVQRDQYLSDLRKTMTELTDSLDGQFVSLPYGGMLAWFGHPVAHLDDADRAVQLAQLLQVWSDSQSAALGVQDSSVPINNLIGIGVASHPEVVASKATELTGAESFRMAAILARHARLIGRPLADESTQKLAPLSVPWLEVKASENNTTPEQKRLGRIAAVGAESLSLVDVRARWGGIPFLNEIFDTVQSGVSQWVSVESWPPAAATTLIDVIGNAAALGQFRLLRLRCPGTNRRERLISSFTSQIENVTVKFGLSKDRMYSYPSAGERLGAMLADCAAEGPIVLQVYGLKALDALKTILGDRGADHLVARPILIVAANLREAGSSQTIVRLLGPRPNVASAKRIFSMTVPESEVLSEAIRVDLQALIDSLSVSANRLITLAASDTERSIEDFMQEMHFPHNQTQNCLHELTASGLVAPRAGGGFQFRDLATAHAIKKLNVPFTLEKAVG